MNNIMETTIKIGAASDNDITKKADDVSQYHAILKISDKEIIIEDLDSTNGTFINDIPVKQALLSPKDRIVLAGKHNVTDLIMPCFKKYFPESDPNDYSEEFKKLKQVYDDYESEQENIIEKSSKRTGWLKFLCLTVPLVGYAFLAHTKSWYLPVYIAANSVLSSLTLFIIKDKSKDSKLKNAKLKFRKSYKCPRPGCGYQLHENWEIHYDQGQCPHCKAIWAKPMEIDF